MFSPTKKEAEEEFNKALNELIFHKGLIAGLLLGLFGNAIISYIVEFIPEPFNQIILGLIIFMGIITVFWTFLNLVNKNQDIVSWANPKNEKDIENYPIYYPQYVYTFKKGMFGDYRILELWWIDRNTGKRETNDMKILGQQEPIIIKQKK